MHLTIYTRRNCHLCDEMKAVVREVGRTLPLTLDEVDVDREPALAQPQARSPQGLLRPVPVPVLPASCRR